MYLSRLRLDPDSAQARRDLADPYELHRTLVRAFVADSASTPPRVLWRLEPLLNWNQPTVLVQSSTAPDWTALTDRPGYLRQEVEVRDLDLDPLLVPGQVLRFRLNANPTVTREGKRHGLVDEDAQLGWLARQGERLGFDLDGALRFGSDWIRARKGNGHISLLQASFEGCLRVRDAERLGVAVRNGIGPGKAFGCGLLSLGRAR